MSKRADNKNVSPDTEIQKKRTDSTPGGSSVDTESQDASPGAMVGDTSVDTESPWEVECSYEGEAGLQKHFTACQKNPDHRNFIPVDEFSIDHLPEGYRDMDMVDYIRAVSDLTVRVTVKYVSDSRPATAPISGKPYPNYSDRGKGMTTVGTGWVEDVIVYNDNRVHGRVKSKVRAATVRSAYTCKCKDCKNSSTPRTMFGVIYINTAAHLVFDDKEGEHATCHLFYDRGGQPDTCSGAIKLSGMLCWGSNPADDMCHLSHYTHDVGLSERLIQICEQRNNLRDKIWSQQPQTWNLKRRRPRPDKQPLLVIVSHPHGYSKQISLGRLTRELVFNNRPHSFMYSTATCPGSSGASVYYPRWLDTLHNVDELWHRSMHAGASKIQPGDNFCHGRVLWENNFNCAEEKDLHKHYDTCQKNPSHLNFIPVGKFTVDNLPPFYRRDNVMKLIAMLADLTVRVSVRYVSEERPLTVPGTDIPYPWYGDRGSNQLRVGSGTITDVDRFPNKACSCRECQSSDTATIGYAHIHIQTASHLVYDKLEGDQTTCQLFFNAGETLAACKGVVQLTNMWSMEVSHEKDMCELIYITHDLNLADRLHTLVDFFNMEVMLLDYDEKNHKSFFNVWVDAEQTGRNKSTLEPPLHIVVSHPHGCAKQVSLAFCDRHGNTDTQAHQCPYKLIVCPGSSGARVISLGWDFLYPSFE